MSWAEILKVNSDVTTPLNELLYTLSPERAVYITETSSYVVPTNCTITIRACGGGGDGYTFPSTSYPYRGGGGGGGYVKDRRRYKKGDTISVTISSKNITIECAERNLSLTATCGGTASLATGYGEGGNASGGNLLNIRGGRGAWYTNNNSTSNQYYFGGNHAAEGNGCGGGGCHSYSNGANGVFAGGHGSSGTFNSNRSGGGDGGSGNFCGGSGGHGSGGSSGYPSNGGRGGNGGNSAWGIGGSGGGSSGILDGSAQLGYLQGYGGNGYLMGGNAGNAMDANTKEAYRAGSSIIGAGGYPNGEGPGQMAGKPYPIRPTERGYGCGGGAPSNNAIYIDGVKGGDALCIIEIGLGEGEY